jgi:2-polyprenyl-3-methyl-5-hydroxy-6-metoxy-1,4-benzoquinol methylase
MDHKEAECFFGYHLNYPTPELKFQTEQGLKSLWDSTHFVSASAILNGADPTETPYAARKQTWNDDSTEGHPDRFAQLIRDIQQNGVTTRIKIAINDRGEAIITDGLHRSGAALALGLKTVPVEIVYRHERWIRLKHLLHQINNGVTLYQPIEHPDFACWPCWRKDSAARVEAINDFLLSKGVAPGASGMDIGCHTGYVTRGLAAHGFYMKGYDIDGRAIEAAEIITEMMTEGLEGIVEFRKSDWRNSDLLVMTAFIVVLSVLNHFMVDPQRSGEGRRMFSDFVNNTNAQYIFLDAPTKGDPVGGDTEFVDPEKVFEWCASSGARGAPIAVIQNDQLMRPILVWGCHLVYGSRLTPPYRLIANNEIVDR